MSLSRFTIIVLVIDGDRGDRGDVVIVIHLTINMLIINIELFLVVNEQTMHSCSISSTIHYVNISILGCSVLFENVPTICH